MKPNKIKTLLVALGTFLFLILVAPFFLFWLPYRMIISETQIYPFEIGVFRFIGTAPILVGIVAFFWSAWSLTFSGKTTPWLFHPPEKLVVRGLYRYVRNPMYVGVISILLGEALLFESTNIFLFALGLFAFFNLLIGVEGYILKQSFGESYEQYRRSVRSWIPRLIPFREDNSKSS